MSTTSELVLIDRFCRVARLYGSGHHLTVNEVSVELFDDPRKLGKLNRSRNPNDLGTAEYRSGIRMMSTKWPSGETWPDDVERPGV